MRWLIGSLFLVFVVAIPAFFIVRKQRMATELEAWLPASGWSPTSCPDGAFGPRPMSESRCFAGTLAGHKAWLLLGRRWKGETANIPRNSGIAQESWVGIAVDDGPVKLHSGLWDRAEIEARLEEVAASLR